MYTILEMHVNLDLEGYEDVDPKMVNLLELNFLTL